MIIPVPETASPQATAQSTAPSAAVWSFLAKATLWSLALFGLLRLAWFDRYMVGALVEFQKTLVFWYGTTPHAGIIVNSSCSGADVMALCAGVTLSYPVAWRRRLVGASAGLALVLLLNIVRIASLHAVASLPETLNLLHVYVWPAVLSLAVLAYVLLWIRASEGRPAGLNAGWRRFAWWSVAMLLLYAAVTPWVFTSALVHQAGVWAASAGGVLLAGFGAAVTTTGNVLVTQRGAFRVTQECLFTPMLPVYAAAVLSMPMPPRRRALGLLLTLPIFFVLGIMRLLVLALPTSLVDSPLFLAHGFYQLIAGAVLIIVAAHLAERNAPELSASRRTAASLGVGVVAGIAAARLWTPLLLLAASIVQAVLPSTLVSLASNSDPQGAFALLPSYQVGLLAGLWFALMGRRGRPRDLFASLAALGAVQVVLLAALGAIAAWLQVEPHALLIRGLAVGIPVVLAAVWAGPGATRIGDRAYHRFWHEVGDAFPSLTGAASTTYYFENEKRLIADALPSLAGCTLLKTDLWDEAKNTRILQWAADRGARVYAIDLSEPIVREARHAFGARPLRPVVSDVRRLPFGDASFDAIYSMGTIEHFAETEFAVGELARILKPGGRLILGVPNRHDPFLRPLLVASLHRLGLYGYGYEKSYSRRSLRRMIEAAGLTVGMESGILFMPGWLRLLDLWCHTRVRSLTAITGPLVQLFVWLDRRSPRLRRHGYLLASVGVKPDPGSAAWTNEPRSVQGPPGPHWQMPDAVPIAGGTSHTGMEYLIDARDCDREALVSLPRLQRLFAEVHADLGLHPLAPPVWHVFPGAGGVTGLVLLSESHLTIHTYPESGIATINLYCCRPSAEWPWRPQLQSLLGARDVVVRALPRG